MSKNRSLDDLVRRAGTILRLNKEAPWRAEFIEIAKEAKSPSSAYNAALDHATQTFEVGMSIDFAKATRFLAIILRDHGQEIFDNAVN